MQVYYHIRKLDRAKGVRVGIVVERDRKVIAHGVFINGKVDSDQSPPARAWAVLRALESAIAMRCDIEQESLVLLGSEAFLQDAEKGTQSGLYTWIAHKLIEEITGFPHDHPECGLVLKKTCTANNQAAEVSQLSTELGLVKVDEF